jgi:hypothetical protein
VRVLSNGSETHALVFPMDGALAGGDYRLRFSLDRARFRSATPDGTSNYRAQVALDMVW